MLLCVTIIQQSIVTPLHEAAQFGHLDVVNSLLGHAKVDARDHHKVTPLMLALRNNHAQVAETLINAGADLNAVDGDGRSVKKYVGNPSIKKKFFHTEL